MIPDGSIAIFPGLLPKYARLCIELCMDLLVYNGLKTGPVGPHEAVPTIRPFFNGYAAVQITVGRRLGDGSPTRRRTVTWATASPVETVRTVGKAW